MPAWSFVLVLLIFAGQISAPPSAPTPPSLSPEQLIQDAIEHRSSDKNQAGNFTYFETWHNQNFDSSGKVIIDASAKFESTVLNGKPYLHMTEQNGQPLRDLDQDVEAHRYDSAIASGAGMTMDQRIAGLVTQKLGFHIQLELLPDYFRCALVGTDVLNGRSAIHLDCAPLRRHKPKDPEKARGVLYHLNIWIDMQDHAFARVDAGLLRRDGDILPGTASTLAWQPIEGVWLPSTMEMHGKAVQREGRGSRTISFATEYAFTNYRRFRTDVRVVPK